MGTQKSNEYKKSLPWIENRGLKQINSEIDTVVKTGHMIFMLTLMWGLLQFLHREFFKLEIKILG